MVIDGRYEIEGVPPERVFEALSDPAILARAVPGCRELVDRGDGLYELAIDAGVGTVRGRYSGEVRIGESKLNELYEAQLQASGSPGSVQAKMRAELAAQNGGTMVTYTMDASLMGPIAGVGQRVLSGASKKNAKMFLSALERELTAAPAPPETATGAEQAGPESAPAGAGTLGAAAPAGPRVYSGAATMTAKGGADDAFRRGVVLGFVLSAATFVLARLLDRIGR